MTDHTAFEAIYVAHAAEVRQTARSVLRDPALAEDVVQDVFERVWRGSGHDGARGPLGPYLKLLARSRALDLWRRGRALDRMQNRLEQRVAAAPGVSDAPEAEVLRNAEQRTARTAVRELPAEQRQVVGLAFWGGLSAQEIATAEGIPLGTAKSRVRLALGKLARDPTFLTAS